MFLSPFVIIAFLFPNVFSRAAPDYSIIQYFRFTNTKILWWYRYFNNPFLLIFFYGVL